MSPTPATLDRSRLEIKLGAYGLASSTSLSDPGILAKVQEYRRHASARMYPIAHEDIVDKIPKADYHVSRKVDGEFNVLVLRDGELFCLNPGGTLRTGLPWQEEADAALKDADVTEVMLSGELYVSHADGRRERVHDIVSIARQPKSQDELDSIHFAVFDVISLNGELQDEVEPYEKRWKWIQETFKESNRIKPVDACWAKQPEEIRAQFETWVADEGSEGLVVRGDTGGHFKIKPRHNLDAVVVGFTESTDDREGMLHDLLLAVRRTDGTYQVLCRVGGGFSDQQRRDILSDLKDLVIDSEYAEVNSDRVAYQMVHPRYVVEISYLDLVSQTTRGGSINRMVLELDESEDHPAYCVVRRMPLAAVISPQFIRIRDDKEAEPASVSIDQVAKQVEVDAIERDAREMKLPASELIQREVYLKELKGKLMVRKFVMWRTNKEQHSEDFPAFVIHYTDFSPNRKAPLDREVRVSNSQEQIEQLWTQLKKANIKSGWKPAEEFERKSEDASSGA